MAYGVSVFNLPGHKAAADYSTKQFRCVKVSAADTVSVCSGATDKAVGILQNKPGQYQAAEVAVLGIAKGICGDTVTAGAQVGTDANGALVAKTTDLDHVIGVALEAGASGTIIAVLLTGPYSLGV